MLDVENIKSRREKLGLTLDEAARLAGFLNRKSGEPNRQQWFLIESGKRSNIELETLGRMAEALQCQPADLLKTSKVKKK